MSWVDIVSVGFLLVAAVLSIAAQMFATRASKHADGDPGAMRNDHVDRIGAASEPHARNEHRARAA